MNIILNSHPDIITFCGGFQRKTFYRYYRKNKFLIESKYSDTEKLIYNAMTGCLVAVKDYEEQNMLLDTPYDYVKFLWENYFIVPEDYDEDAIITEFRKRRTNMVTCTNLDTICTYTILSTTKCNARCFYCYQNINDPNKVNMTTETAQKVAQYILKTADRHIFLNWFGGEPMYNFEVMEIISNSVKASGIEMTTHITSNGYLLNEENVKKMREEWNFDYAQITLDGTEEVYNRIKKYIYKDDPNPFATVISNIHTMLRYNVQVAIRLNCEVHNATNLKELITYLNNEFTDTAERKFLTVYAHELFDETNKRSDDHNKRLFENMIEINEMLVNLGLNTFGNSINGIIKTIHCMADDNRSVVIMPSGDLGLCEHYEKTKYFGHINDIGKKDFDVIRSWRQMEDYAEICNDCPYKPECLKSPQCPDHNICNKYEKEYIIDRARKDMIVHYNRWKVNTNYNNINNNNPNRSSRCNQQESIPNSMINNTNNNINVNHLKKKKKKKR